MVDKVKAVTKDTARKIENLYEVLSLAAIIAAAVKVTSETKVFTGFGELPVWQVVAAVLLAGVSYRVYGLINKAQ